MCAKRALVSAMVPSSVAPKAGSEGWTPFGTPCGAPPYKAFFADSVIVVRSGGGSEIEASLSHPSDWILRRLHA